MLHACSIGIRASVVPWYHISLQSDNGEELPVGSESNTRTMLQSELQLSWSVSLVKQYKLHWAWDRLLFTHTKLAMRSRAWNSHHGMINSFMFVEQTWSHRWIGDQCVTPEIGQPTKAIRPRFKSRFRELIWWIIRATVSEVRWLSWMLSVWWAPLVWGQVLDRPLFPHPDQPWARYWDGGSWQKGLKVVNQSNPKDPSPNLDWEN